MKRRRFKITQDDERRHSFGSGDDDGKKRRLHDARVFRGSHRQSLARAGREHRCAGLRLDHEAEAARAHHHARSRACSWCSRSTRARCRTSRSALKESKIGIMPAVDGKIIRLPIPELSEERRKDLVKSSGKMAEEARVRVRSESALGIGRSEEIEDGRRRDRRRNARPGRAKSKS